MKRKFLAILLITTTVLSGCGSSSTSEQSLSNNNDVTTEQVQVSTEIVSETTTETQITEHSSIDVENLQKKNIKQYVLQCGTTIYSFQNKI